MKSLSVMLIAGEASGDLLAAELVGALRAEILARSEDDTNDPQPLRTALAPRFFGAGGPNMAAAGVELACDLTEHSAVGVTAVVAKLPIFLQRLAQLQRLAIERQPDVIVLVDFSVFNHMFARRLRRHLAAHRSAFNNWSPHIVKYVSPNVWASRPGRAYRMPADFDLLLSIFPFEKAWYAARVPKLHVEFVGHPLVERMVRNGQPAGEPRPADAPSVVLLPGSRTDEVRRHLPVMTAAFGLLRQEFPRLTGRMVLPNERLRALVQSSALPAGVGLQTGGLASALGGADLALAKSGTVTLECAAFGVPAVVLYKASTLTYLIARPLITVKYLAMPNLLADASVYPEFFQHEATAENLAGAALRLLRDESHRHAVKTRLAAIMESLGSPGAAHRAAAAILRLLP